MAVRWERDEMERESQRCIHLIHPYMSVFSLVEFNGRLSINIIIEVGGFLMIFLDTLTFVVCEIKWSVQRNRPTRAESCGGNGQREHVAMAKNSFGCSSHPRVLLSFKYIQTAAFSMSACFPKSSTISQRNNLSLDAVERMSSIMDSEAKMMMGSVEANSDEVDTRITHNQPTHVERWDLPQGAEYIIRQIAAEQILFELLGDIFSMAQVGNESKGEKRTADFSTVLSIAKEFPAACQRQYEFMWEDGANRALYPLAALCCLRPPADVVKVVHEAYPDAISMIEETRESLPVHYACGFGASLEVVEYLIESYPDSIRACRTDSVTPLHLACAYYANSPDVISYLLDQFPEGAQQAATDMTWLPIHSASHGGAHVSVMERLYKLNPPCVLSADSKGRTPLHIACERKGNFEGVKFIVSKAPQLCGVEDDSRFTPLSLAAMHQDVDTLKLLLEHSEILEDQHGVTLLHMAAFQNTVDVIDWLATKYPAMVRARVRDSDMYTPLLAACRHDAPVEVVRALIQHDPRTLNMPDGEGRPPIESARQAGADNEVIKVIQEELNAIAAAEFAVSWPQLFRDHTGRRARKNASTTENPPELETTYSFSSDSPSISEASDEIREVTRPSRTYSAGSSWRRRPLQLLRGLRILRRRRVGTNSQES